MAVRPECVVQQTMLRKLAAPAPTAVIRAATRASRSAPSSAYTGGTLLRVPSIAANWTGRAVREAHPAEPASTGGSERACRTRRGTRRCFVVAATLRAAPRRGAPSYLGNVNVSGDLAAYWKKVAHAQDFHVRAVVSQRRDSAILLGKHAISRNGGDIVDFRMFSNLALSMIVEVEGGRMLSLVDSLVALGWHVDVDLDREALAERTSDLLAGTFHLTFPECDGKRATPAPAVPV